MLTGVDWGGGGGRVGVGQALGGVLVPKSGLACCKKGPKPLVCFCIETDTRACWCLVRGGLLGLDEEEEEVIA